jgi:hypothetical protein
MSTVVYPWGGSHLVCYTVVREAWREALFSVLIHTRYLIRLSNKVTCNEFSHSVSALSLHTGFTLFALESELGDVG